jgi:oligosaccharide repeat unit polymerase
MNELSNWPAIVVAAFLAAVLAVDLRRNVLRLMTGRSVVLVAVMLWYVLEALRTPTMLREYTQGEYHFGLFCIVLSVAAFLVAYHGARIRLFAPLARRLSIFDDSHVLWLLMLTGMAIGFGGLLIYVNFNLFLFFEGLGGLSRRWESGIGRGRYGSWDTILYELQIFLQATTPLAICLALTKRAPFVQRCVAVLFVVWMFLRTFSSGSRGPLLPIILCVAAAVVWRAGPRLRRGLLIVGLPVLMVGGYLFSAVVVAGRTEGDFDLSNYNKREDIGFEMFRELLFVIRAEENGMAQQYGFTYFTQLVNPIPRAIWPGKPVGDAGLVMARAYGSVDRSGEPTMTISPGFLGEAYLNFGFLGVLIVPAAAGIFVRAWDCLLPTATRSLPAFLVYVTGLAIIFLCGRSFNFGSLYGLLALFTLVILFEQIGWARFPNRQSRNGQVSRQPQSFRSRLRIQRMRIG